MPLPADYYFREFIDADSLMISLDADINSGDPLAQHGGYFITGIASPDSDDPSSFEDVRDMAPDDIQKRIQEMHGANVRVSVDHPNPHAWEGNLPRFEGGKGKGKGA